MFTANVTTPKAKAILQGAILLYGPERSGPSASTFATVHEADIIDSRPHLMPGRLITQQDLESLYQGVVQANTDQSTVWLDERVLAKGPERMVWWTPPGHRPLFFRKSRDSKGTFDGSALCPLPSLVWMVTNNGSLFVYASASSVRPSKETQLYQAPFFNVWGIGQVCVGTAVRPQDDQAWDPQAWENFFFGSHFTHANFSEANRLIKSKSPVRFWKEMVENPPEDFPTRVLVKVPLNAGDLTDAGLLDRLNKWPKPKGEF
jgi:PRTRC genetic system protein B